MTVKRRGLGRKPGPDVHDDLVEGQFTAPASNVVWLADITEHPTDEGKLYMCAVKDVYSGRIVGYSMAERMTSGLCVSALRNAIALRSPHATIVHTDRGSQFRPRAFVGTINANKLRGSMGRVGACADNAAAVVETGSQLRFVHPPEHGALGRKRCARPRHQVRIRAEHALQVLDAGISNLGGARRQPAESLNEQRRCGLRRSVGPRRPAGAVAHGVGAVFGRGSGPRATQLKIGRAHV